jgi:hypothetical protein
LKTTPKDYLADWAVEMIFLQISKSVLLVDTIVCLFICLCLAQVLHTTEQNLITAREELHKTNEQLKTLDAAFRKQTNDFAVRFCEAKIASDN